MRYCPRWRICQGGWMRETDRSILCLVSTAKVFCQKLLSSGIKLEAVFRFSKAVSFIREEHVFVINSFALHSFNYLLRFCLLHSRIVGSLCYQHRYLDLIDLKQW